MAQMFESAMVLRALKFGYANARVKSSKQNLLGQKELGAMIEARSVPEIYSILEKTPYREDLVASSLNEKTIADKIELACSHNFSRTLAKILKMSPRDSQEKIGAMFEKYDLNNIKTILIAKHTNEDKKIEPLLLDTGSTSKGLLSRLLSAKGIKEAVAELGGTPYGSILEKNMKKYEKEGEITVLIAALDDYYYKKLPQIAKNPYGDERVILAMLKSEADLKNVSNILRAKKAGLKEDVIEEMIIGSGNIPKEKLLQAASAKSVEDSMKVFEKNFKIAKAIEAYRKNSSLIPLEMELEKGVAKKGLSTLRTSVLSLGAIAGFLFLKEEEVSNIRKIVRAKEYNLPEEKIREMLVIV